MPINSPPPTPDAILEKNQSAPNQSATVSNTAFPASPASFAFAGKVYQGVLTGWDGAQERRHVIFVNPKRPGQSVEDMERGGRWIAVRMKFVGPNAARDANAFKSAIDRSPFGRLDHPTGGQYRAFCTVASERVDFGRAINLVEINSRFIEAQLDGVVQPSTPDVGTAAQNVASQKTAYQQSVAAVMGAYGKAQTQATNALNSIDSALDDVKAVAAPVALMQGVVNRALGAASKIAGTINAITSLVDVVNADVDAFTNVAVDLFTDLESSPVGQLEAVSSTLVQVRNDAQLLVDAMARSSNPDLLAIGGNAAAAMAPGVEDTLILVDNCLTLYDALLAQLPPVALYIVPATVNIIILAQRLLQLFNISGRAAEAYASTIMAINSIPTPQAIPAGSELDVPTA